MTSAGKSWNGIISIAVGTGLAVLSIALTGWDGFWKTFEIADDQKSIVAGALAILFVNLGFLVGVYYQQNDFKTEILEGQRAGLQDLRSVIPTIRVFATYTGEGAMAVLASALPTAAVALNTRVLSSKMSEASHAAASPWDLAIRASVRNGLTFREVVSPDNETLARERLRSASGGKGRYHAAVLRHNLPSFMNFIVIEASDGRKEVWFGWIVSPTAGWEGTVVRSGEAKIVSLFERWHAELFAASRQLA